MSEPESPQSKPPPNWWVGLVSVMLNRQATERETALFLGAIAVAVVIAIVIVILI